MVRTLGGVGLDAVMALAVCGVVAMLVTLTGFLVACRGADGRARESLFNTLAQTMRDIGRTDLAHSIPQRRRRRPHRRPEPIDHRDGSETVSGAGHAYRRGD